MVVRGQTVTLVERRAPGRADSGREWSTLPRARLRFDGLSRTWTLWWRDADEHWQRDKGVVAAPYVESPLAALEADRQARYRG